MGKLRTYDTGDQIITIDPKTENPNGMRLSTASREVREGRMHFWTIRKGMDLSGDFVMMMPRNVYSARLMLDHVDPTEHLLFQHVVSLPVVKLPETTIANLVGRVASTVVDHWVFAPGSRGAEAIVTLAQQDEPGDPLVLVFDRPVHPDPDEVQDRIDFARAKRRKRAKEQGLQSFTKEGVVQLWGVVEEEQA